MLLDVLSLKAERAAYSVHNNTDAKRSSKERHPLVRDALCRGQSGRCRGEKRPRPRSRCKRMPYNAITATALLSIFCSDVINASPLPIDFILDPASSPGSSISLESSSPTYYKSLPTPTTLPDILPPSIRTRLRTRLQGNATSSNSTRPNIPSGQGQGGVYGTNGQGWNYTIGSSSNNSNTGTTNEGNTSEVLGYGDTNLYGNGSHSPLVGNLTEPLVFPPGHSLGNARWAFLVLGVLLGIGGISGTLYYVRYLRL